MTCQSPRAPHHPGMKTSSLMLSLSPTQGPEEDPQAQLGPQGRRDHQGLQVPQAPKVTGARQERKAQQGLPASWGHQGPAGFLERWGALDPLAPPAQQAARASLQMAPKASSTPCSHLPTRTMETHSWLLPWTRCWRVSQGRGVLPGLQVPLDHMVPQDPQVHLDPRAWLENGARQGHLVSLVGRGKQKRKLPQRARGCSSCGKP